MRFGQIEVRPDERHVRVGGQSVAVSARAYDLLWALIQHRDRVVTKNELLDWVWPGVVVEEHNLHAQVSLLRKAIGAKAIATIPGRGYRFVAVDANDGPSSIRPEVPVLRVDPATDEATDERAPPRAEQAGLIGREADLDALANLLGRSRILTICGAGGVGKTTVARALVEQVAVAKGSDVAWVELAPLRDAAGLPGAIAAALNIGERTDLTPAALGRALARRQTLVVLDNCEHLIDPVASLVQALVDASSAATFLTTSREPLKLRDEQCYFLEGLACVEASSPPLAAGGPAALRLFEARARLHDSRFQFAPAQLESAVELCRMLDGNPLAIEMAASCVRTFGIGGVEDRLGRRVEFLRSGMRHPAHRHSSLWATLDWSYSLLSESAQHALRLLSVFAGPFELDAAERLLQVAGVAPPRASAAIAELAGKSLLLEPRGVASRPRLAEVTRLFAAELMDRRGERCSALRLHVRVMGERATRADERFWLLSDRSWLAQYGSELPDAMQAFARACERGDADAAGALGMGLRPHFILKGLDAPARRASRQLLDLLPHAGRLAEARIWTFVSSMNPVSANGVSPLDAVRKRLALWRAVGDPVGIHDALCRYAAVLAEQGDFAQAEAALAELEQMAEPETAPRRRQFLARTRALVAQLAGAPDVEVKLRAALRLASDAGVVAQVARGHIHLAEIALVKGDHAEALAHCRASAEVTIRNDGVFLLPNSDLEVLVYTVCGAFDDARLAGSRAVARAAEMGIVAAPANSIALLAARLGHWRESAQLLGAYDEWAEALNIERSPSGSMALRLSEASIDHAIGRERHFEERAIGKALMPDDVHALVLRLMGEASTAADR